MQLPRGQFHRLLKSTTSGALIEEMGSKQFTGICTILIDGESAVLVLENGQVVLAEYGGIKGQHALDEVLKDEVGEIAAELNLLTPEQLQLALEFNQPFATGNSGAGRPGEAPPGTTAPGGGKAPAGQKHPPERPRERRHIPMPGVKPAQEKGGAPPSTDDEVDTLVQNMEDMDIDQLVSKFRVSCKDMLRKINLDHLIQDKDT